MPTPSPGSGVRFDGIYQWPNEPWIYCLRFKADGTVESICLQGTSVSAEDVASKLDARLAKTQVHGPFAVEGDRLTFSVTSANGTIDYGGKVTSQGELVLDSHSHINGNREKGAVYGFTEVSRPRRLYEMVPRCLKLDCGKIKYGTVYEHGCGIRVTDGGWPLPSEGETAIGRWNVIGSRLHIDMNDDPSGPYVREGSLGVLVTDKAVRGSFYEGKGRVGKLGIQRHVFTFYWPYSLMKEPTLSHYQDDRRMHLIIEDPDQDGHLGLQGITKPKSRKEDDFLSPVLSMKNRIDELADQLTSARARHLAH